MFVLLMLAVAASGMIILPLIPHDQVVRRRLSSLPNKTLVDPLYQGLGTHYVDMWLGCPEPQRQTVIVDTASSITGIPCDSCPPSDVDQNHCSLGPDNSGRHTDTNYKTNRSQCFKFFRCEEQDVVIGSCAEPRIPDEEKESADFYIEHYTDRYRQVGYSYADGSHWSGHVAADKVYTGGLHEAATETETAFFPFVFGCQETISGLMTIQLSDGVMGMDRTKSSYWQQWLATQEDPNPKRNKVHPSAQFSLCFVLRPKHYQDGDGAGAGAMVLGGVDPRLNEHPMAYAQMIRDDNFYVVWVERIYLRRNGGDSVAAENPGKSIVEPVMARPVELNRGKFVLDSASSGFHFSKSLEEPFKKAWQNLMGKKYDPQENLYTNKELEALPTILIQLSPRDRSETINQTQPGLAGRDHLDKDNPRSVVVALSPSHYMRFIAKRKTHASQIVFTVPDGEQQTLGVYLFAGHNIHFDVHGERIGFAESDCNFWKLGNANFNHTPHEGDVPPSPPPWEDPDEEDNNVEEVTEPVDAQSGDWACGSVSCGTAIGVIVGLLVVLLVCACCRRVCCSRSPVRSRRNDGSPRRKRENAFDDQPRFRDEPNVEEGEEESEEENDDHEDDSSEDSAEGGYELPPMSQA